MTDIRVRAGWARARARIEEVGICTLGTGMNTLLYLVKEKMTFYY